MPFNSHNLLNLLETGKNFNSKETIDDRLKALSDRSVLRLMRYIASKPSYFDAHQRELLGVLGACAHLLKSRKSPVVENNPGIPFTELEYLHRILNAIPRFTKLLPDHAFTEGVYYDPELNKLALEKIIAKDLPELQLALNKILSNNIYQQHIPLANNTRKIHSFYYDECHLNFIRHACYTIIDIIKLNKPVIDSVSDTDTKEKFNQLIFKANLIYFINLGEAFAKLSSKSLNGFEQHTVDVFKQARNILSHPERLGYQDKLEELRQTTLNIFDPDFIITVTKILINCNLQLTQQYGYKFNIDFRSVFSNYGINNNGGFDVINLPPELQRMIACYENYCNLQNSDPQLSIAYIKKNPNQILDDTNPALETFEKKHISAILDGKSIECYYSAIAYLEYYFDKYIALQTKLEHYFDKFIALKTKPESTYNTDEKEFIKKYQETYQAVINKLVSKEKGLSIIRYRLFFCLLFNNKLPQDPCIISTLNAYKELDKNIKIIRSRICSSFKDYNPSTIEDISDVLELAHLSDSIINNPKEFDRARFEAKMAQKSPSTTKSRNEKNIDDKTQASYAVKLMQKVAISHADYRFVTDLLKQLYSNNTNARGVDDIINKIKTMISGSTSWYYSIVTGSLTRDFLRNPIIANYNNEEFKKFFRENFQIPRGDLAHNQISEVGGDPDYVDYLQKYQDGLNCGEVVVQTPMLRTVSGIQRAQDGSHYIESFAFKHFSAASIDADAILNDDKLQPTYFWLLFLSNKLKNVYVNFHLLRENNQNVALTLYLADRICKDLQEVKAKAFVCASLDTSENGGYIQNESLDIKKLIDRTLRKLKNIPGDFKINFEHILCEDKTLSPVRRVIHPIYNIFADNKIDNIDSKHGYNEEPAVRTDFELDGKRPRRSRSCG